MSPYSWAIPIAFGMIAFVMVIFFTVVVLCDPLPKALRNGVFTFSLIVILGFAFWILIFVREH